MHWKWYNAVASKHYTVQGAFAGVDVVPTLSEWNKMLDDNVREMEARLEAQKQAEAERKANAKKKAANAFFFVLGVVVAELINLLFEFLR